MEQGIFAVADRSRLEAMLDDLHAFLSVPIRLVDEAGNTILMCGEQTEYCRLLQKHAFGASACKKQQTQAAHQAQILGEAYIFNCHANLDSIAYPLAQGGRLLGSVIIGPFLMDNPDSTLVSDIVKGFRLSSDITLDLFEGLYEIRVFEPGRVTRLSRLTGALFSPLLGTGREELRSSRDRFEQQSRINEAIQQFKRLGIQEDPEEYYRREGYFLTALQAGDRTGTSAHLNELLGYLFYTEGLDAATARYRAAELIALACAPAMSSGADTGSLHHIRTECLHRIRQAQAADQVCASLQEAVEQIAGLLSPELDRGEKHIRKVLSYMNAHSAEGISLSSASLVAELSPAYLSRLFHETVGVPFREHLCRIRVENAKRLLRNTDEPLSAVAAATGFADQSHFSKTFLRLTGMTPGQYRGK